MPHLGQTACSWALGLTQGPRDSLSTGKGCPRAEAELQLLSTLELVGLQGALLSCSPKATGAVQEREVQFAGGRVPLTQIIFKVKIQNFIPSSSLEKQNLLSLLFIQSL